MPWKWRRYRHSDDEVFVELLEHGTINVTAPAAAFTPDARRWIDEVAVPELQAEWAEHKCRQAEMAERERRQSEMAAAEERAKPKRVGLTLRDAEREVGRAKREEAERDRAERERVPRCGPLTLEQLAYIVNVTPDPVPEQQTFEQRVYCEASSACYGYMLDYGLPSIDFEATKAVMREMLSEAA